jgi:hypothetical protein
VIVEVNAACLAELMQVFASVGSFEDLTEGYSDEQLETIISYLNRATQRSQEAIALLREKDSSTTPP